MVKPYLQGYLCSLDASIKRDVFFDKTFFDRKVNILTTPTVSSSSSSALATTPHGEALLR